MHHTKRSRRGGTASQNSAARRVDARRAAATTSARDNRVTPGLLKDSGKPKRSRAVKLTDTQRNSEGRRSEWSAPAQLPMALTVTTHQAAWDRTVYSNRPA